MRKRNSWFHAIFLVIVIVELISRWFDNHLLEYGAKPFILTWIAVFYILNSKKEDIRISLILAFLFSWLGDMFLMLAHKNEVFFFAGVGGFFFAQCFFIYTFLKTYRKDTQGFLRKKPYWIIIFLGLLGLMIWYLHDGLEGIMLPIIIIYGISLFAMSAAALNRLGAVNIHSFILVFYGSVAFVLSDSLIAITKFKTEIPHSSFLVISVYILAQYMIMRGMLMVKKKSAHC